tara:strand:+ start:133 stop:348 length:216 start_codon:yes stop_codon:yes gene_type:complete
MTEAEYKQAMAEANRHFTNQPTADKWLEFEHQVKQGSKSIWKGKTFKIARELYIEISSLVDDPNYYRKEKV